MSGFIGSKFIQYRVIIEIKNNILLCNNVFCNLFRRIRRLVRPQRAAESKEAPSARFPVERARCAAGAACPCGLGTHPIRAANCGTHSSSNSMIHLQCPDIYPNIYILFLNGDCQMNSSHTRCGTHGKKSFPTKKHLPNFTDTFKLFMNVQLFPKK